MTKSKRLLANKITLINMISSLLLQFVTIISGFIIPKLILDTFGSNVNGLVSSLNQFLSYITLVEGGITGVIMTNLYKPLVDKDYEKVSKILKTASNFYKRIGFLFIIYMLIVGLGYPIVFDTSFSYVYIFSLTIILSMNLFIQYMFSLTLRTFLSADKKIYVISIVQIIITIFNVIFVIISTKVFKSIHILKLASGLLYLLQPIVFGIYIKKNYKLNFKTSIDNNKYLIKQRWNGFAINTASFIHNCTDVTVLTAFTDLPTVSVYSIYALITTSLKQLINSITVGINPTIGQTYARGNIDEINKTLELYEYIVFILVFCLFSIAGILITPFVLLYTSGINDANYNQPLFGILLVVSEALYLLKLPHLNLAYSANKYKELTIPAFIEAILNIIISIILVNKFGLIGVAIGTCVAMLYRLIFHIQFTKKLIGREQWSFYYKLLLFLITNIIGIVICVYLIPNIKIELLSWIIHAIIYTVIIVILNVFLSILFFKKELLIFFKYLKH